MHQGNKETSSATNHNMIAEKMKLIKKGRPKNQVLENGNHSDQGEKNKLKRRKKKAFEQAQDEIVKQISKVKKENKNDTQLKKEEEILNFMNTNFGARVKRKCVLQNEAKTTKDNWWSDDEEEEEEEEDEDQDQLDSKNDKNGDEETTVKEEDERTGEHLQKQCTVELDDHQVIQVENSRKRRRRSRQPKLQKQERVSSSSPQPPSTKTVRCYVFSTGMANRAGFAVSNNRHISISEYHHQQKWDTPYLNPEIHCRPFFPEMESLEHNKDIVADCDIATSFLNNEASDTKTETTELAVDTPTTNIWNNTVNNFEPKLELENVRSPVHPRNNLVQGSTPPLSNADTAPPLQKNIKEIDDEKSPVERQDSEEINVVPTVTIEQDDSKLVPNISTIQSTNTLQKTSTIRVNSYPADITNVPKEQLRFHSPRLTNSNYANGSISNVLSSESSAEFKRVNEISSSRPSVLNMVSARKSENETIIRSSIDVAEKILKESRNAQSVGSSLPYTIPPSNLKSSNGGPILPRDVHPSVFMSNHSPNLHSSVAPHLHQSAFTSPHESSLHNGSIFSSRHHKGPFTPPPSSHPRVTPFHSPRNDLSRTIHPSRNVPSIVSHPYNRHKPPSPNNYQSPEAKYCERYKPLSSTLKSSTMERPSSLPVPSTHRIEKKPSKSFSVESLTQNKHEAKKDQLNSEPSVQPHSVNNRLPSRITDRPPLLPDHEHLHHERMRIPNGGNGINGLKLSLDERLSNHMRERIYQHDKSILDKFHHDDRYLAAAKHERFSHEKDAYFSGKERFMHHPRMPFPLPTHHSESSRASLMIPPPSFMSGTTSAHGGGDPPQFHPGAYSHLLRMGLHPFASPPFSHR